jgi:PAS domain-containing protein
MKILTSAMLAPGTALVAGLLGFVLTALFFALIPSRRATRREGIVTDHPQFWQMLLRKGGLNEGWAVAVLDGAGACLFLCGRAEQYLEDCRAQIGPALSNLTRDGIGFDLKIALSATEHLRVTGRPVGRRAVLYFTPQAQDSAAETQLRREAAAYSMLIRKLPVAVAAFGADRRLWAFSNAYAELWGLTEIELERQPFEDEILDRLREAGRLPEQGDFSIWKRRQLRQTIGTRETWHLPGGRSLRVTQHMGAEGKLIQYEDVSRQLALETENSLHKQVQKATLDTLDEGVAIFGTDGRLELGNSCFATQWQLPESVLLRHPHYSEIAAGSSASLGPDGIWDAVAQGVIAAEAASIPAPRVLQRADGRSFLVTLSRLPNGTTMVNFLDFDDLERFEAMLAEDRALSWPSNRKTGDK